MVNKIHTRFTLIVLISLTLIFSFGIAIIKAESLTYRVDYEYVKIWINDDGTIDLLYGIKVTCYSGTMTGFYIGQPTGDFKIGEAKDATGTQLNARDVSEGNNYRADVTLLKPISKGESSEFTLSTNVGKMIFKDEQNPGNYGMKFTPTWFDDAELADLKLLIIFPPGTKVEDVKNTPDWDSTQEEEGRLATYWERQNFTQGQRFEVGVSFPSSLLPNYKADEGSSGISSLLIPLIILIFIAIFAFLFIRRFITGIKRTKYLSPQIGMESLGIKAGLTAVEAAQLIDVPPQKVVTAILYGLLLKKVISVEGTDPSIKLRASPQPQELRYYEIDFIKAIKPDGFLSEEKLAQTIMYLRDTVDNKIKGYCREDTINHYKSVVAEAWKQVETAQTPELASNLFNEQLLWLMLDGKYVDRTREKFTPIIFIPSPDWGWYYYNRRYLPKPETLPQAPSPTQPSKTTIPGADFADSVARSFEQTSSKIVLSMEKFTKSILPPPTQQAQSHAPAQHRSNCVCACHTCACACACVSCACACAGGGGH